MLKIKDDVDLKELEKFGFEYEEDEDEYYWCKYLSDNEHIVNNGLFDYFCLS